MRYVNIFVFDSSLEYGFLVKKNHTLYAGRYNALGGEVNCGESDKDASIREIKEETGLSVVDTDLAYLGKLLLPSDCKYPDEKSCELTWYAVISPDRFTLPDYIDSGESVHMFKVKDILNSTLKHLSSFAGDGDILYFLNVAFNKLQI